MDEDFVLKSAGASPQTGQEKACCPLAVIPYQTWQRLFKPPFRARHPFLFWGGCLLILALLVSGLFSLFAHEEEADTKNCLALVNIQGPIMGVESILDWIRKLENTPGVKGVLVRVDSPGGGAAASQEVYSALARLGEKLPIAVSMGAMAASGGLMVSMAGQRIFANPSTITGSIGVRMDIPQIQGLMDKIGISQETLTTAPFKDAASYMHPLSPDARAYLEKVLMNMHEQFVAIVAKGRKMSLDKAGLLASGKIFTGEQALGLGLVDVLGGQYEAHKWLSDKTGIPQKNKLFRRKAREKGILELLAGAASILGFDIHFLDSLEQGPSSIRPVFLYQF